MEGRILTSDVRLPALEAEDALMISKLAKYVQRIDKQVTIGIILLLFVCNLLHFRLSG